jgi:hypothetical protein
MFFRCIGILSTWSGSSCSPLFTLSAVK